MVTALELLGEKYMHLAPGAQAAAVRLFDQERGTGVASLDGSGEK
jgi:hypothetical protein